MPRSLLACAVAVTTGALAAQVTPIPGSGCALPATTVVLGSPQAGNTILISNPFATACLLQTAVVIAGLPQPTPWTNCIGSPCTIAVFPVVFAIGLVVAALPVQIPNDPGLVGFCFDAQSGCLSPTCINVDRAVRICVQ